MKHSKLIWMVALLMSGMLVVSCSSTKKSNMETKPGSTGISSPPAIVYKTRKDYSQNVPVVLSVDKKKIVSYPAQSDLKRGNNFSYPGKLSDGYLLDNRGISPNTAFLRFTYEDYYNMDNIPTADRLLEYIIDDDPFTEFYEVGRRGDFENIEEDINTLIGSRKFKKFKNLAE